MSQELKRNKFVKPDSCLIDPGLGSAEAVAAAMAASGAWGALPLPPLPTSSPGGLPPLNGDAGLPFPGLPALPMPMPPAGGEPAPPPLDPAALAAAMAAAGAGLDSAAQPSQGGRGARRGEGLARAFAPWELGHECVGARCRLPGLEMVCSQCACSRCKACTELHCLVPTLPQGAWLPRPPPLQA